MHPRAATSADVTGLVPLLQHLSCLVWNGDERELLARIEKFVATPGPGHLFVVGEPGKPLAAAVVYELPLVGTAQNQVLLDDLVVGPEGRGKGLGKLLAKHVVDWAASRGAAHVSARVDPSEPAGARMYEAVGMAPADQLMQKSFG